MLDAALPDWRDAWCRTLIGWMLDALLWLAGYLMLHFDWLDVWCCTLISWMLDAALWLAGYWMLHSDWRGAWYRCLSGWMLDAALWLAGCWMLPSDWLDTCCRTVWLARCLMLHSLIGWMLDAAMSGWLMWCVGEERADGDGDPQPESRLWALPLHAGHHGLHRGLCSGENKNKSYLFLLVPVWYVCLRDSVARFPPPLFLSYLTQLGPWLTCWIILEYGFNRKFENIFLCFLPPSPLCKIRLLQ